jgi:hypothetical protein
MSKPIDTFLALGRVVAAGREPPEHVAKSLGTIENDLGGTLYIKPADVGYGEVRVFYDQATRRLSMVTVTAKEQGKLPTLAELQARLGQYVTAPKMYRTPRALKFTVDFGKEHDRTCAVVARIPNDDRPVEEWRVAELDLIAESRP